MNHEPFYSCYNTDSSDREAISYILYANFLFCNVFVNHTLDHTLVGGFKSVCNFCGLV